MRRSILKEPGQESINVNTECADSRSRMATSFEKLAGRPLGLKYFVVAICIFAFASFVVFSLYSDTPMPFRNYFKAGSKDIKEKIGKAGRNSHVNSPREGNPNLDGDKNVKTKEERESQSLTGGSKATEMDRGAATDKELKNKEQATKKQTNNVNSKAQTKSDNKQKDHEDYNVLLQLVNAEPDSIFAKNFYHCIKSILTRTKLNLKFHLTVDPVSKTTAENIFNNMKKELHLHQDLNRTYYLVEEVNKKVYPYTKTLQV